MKSDVKTKKEIVTFLYKLGSQKIKNHSSKEKRVVSDKSLVDRGKPVTRAEKHSSNPKLLALPA